MCVCVRASLCVCVCACLKAERVCVRARLSYGECMCVHMCTHARKCADYSKWLYPHLLSLLGNRGGKTINHEHPLLNGSQILMIQIWRVCVCVKLQALVYIPCRKEVLGVCVCVCLIHCNYPAINNPLCLKKRSETKLHLKRIKPTILCIVHL